MEHGIRFEEENWRLLELSKINDAIITQLVNNLQNDLSEDFFISLESLLDIGKRALPIIKKKSKEENLNRLTRSVLTTIMSFIEEEQTKDPLIIDLYNPDFVTRARAITRAEIWGDSRYVEYIMPLVGDPDDSVRWAAVNFLLRNHPRDKTLFLELKERLRVESNPVIRRKLKESLSSADL